MKSLPEFREPLQPSHGKAQMVITHSILTHLCGPDALVIKRALVWWLAGRGHPRHIHPHALAQKSSASGMAVSNTLPHSLHDRSVE